MKPSKTTLVGATVIVGSLVGIASDGMGLLDRMNGTSDVSITTGHDATEALPTGMSSVSPKPAGQDAAVAVDPGANAPAPAPQPAAAAPDPLTRAVSMRISEELDALGCKDITVQSVRADGRFTPAAEATSGFDSLYVEGSAALRSADGVTRIPLAGSGKGPANEARAITAVARNFSRELSERDLGALCKTLDEK